MGLAMARNLAEKHASQSSLAVYNRTRSRSEELDKGTSALIEICDSIAELIKASDVVFICLANDQALQRVIGEAVSVDLGGKLIVDQSTVHPDTTRSVANQLHSHKCAFLAAPVFGAPAAAVAAKLVVAYAGPEDAYARAAPYFPSMSRAQFSLGADPGKASLMKITGNTFILSMIETVAEGLTFAEVSGLGVDNCMTFLSTMFGGTPWESYAGRMTSGGYMPAEGDRPGFAVDIAHKDCSHALNLAQGNGYAPPFLKHIQTSLASVSKDERYGGRGDVSSVYGVERERAGLQLENEQVAKRAKKA
jgi:3-hydroxyisobutyrate dehydrogenase-like beta-hydroxyacid dehydrogenase